MKMYISSLNIGDGQIEMILFDQIGDAINKGSKEFCENILLFLNLKLKVKSWNIDVCRTNHFSDYIGEDDWRDVWQIVWKLKIYTHESDIPVIQLPDVFVELDITDDSWNFSESDLKETKTSCLIISYFLSEKDKEKAIDKISSTDFSLYRNNYNTPVPKFSENKILNTYFQLTIDLGIFQSDFYSTGAQYVEEIIKICKEFNGITHYSSIP
jgi:hypothetical protein